MPQDLQESVFLITDGENRKFGTGFAIWKNDNEVFVLTCDHVIDEFKDIQKLLVAGCAAKVVVSGKEHDIDLAVLKVEGLQDKPLVKLCSGGEQGRSFLTAGFSTFGKERIIETLQGELAKPVGTTKAKPIGATKKNLVPAWYLRIIDGELKSGYSGSPVLDEQSGEVIGVVSYKDKDTTTNLDTGGLAISVEALKQILRGSEIEGSVDIRNPSNVKLTNIDPINRYEHCCWLSLESTSKEPEVFLLSLTACFGEQVLDEFAARIGVKRGELTLKINGGSLSEIKMRGSSSCEVHRKGSSTEPAWDLLAKSSSTVLRGELKKQDIATLSRSRSLKCYVEIIFKAYGRDIAIEHLGDLFSNEEEETKRMKTTIIEKEILERLKLSSNFETRSDALVFSIHSYNL